MEKLTVNVLDSVEIEERSNGIYGIQQVSWSELKDVTESKGNAVRRYGRVSYIGFGIIMQPIKNYPNTKTIQ